MCVKNGSCVSIIPRPQPSRSSVTLICDSEVLRSTVTRRTALLYYRFAREAVFAHDFGDAHAIGAIPALAAELLRAEMLGDRLPRARGGGIAPIADGDAEPAGTARALDAEVTRLLGAEPLHLGGHRVVAGVVLGRAQRREQDGDIRRLRRCGDHR